MAALPYRPLAGFYFFYFAYIGAFAPFFAIYLSSAGLDAVQIGVVMALPQVTRIVAPHLWGWLADAGGERMKVVRITTLAAVLSWPGMFAGIGGTPAGTPGAVTGCCWAKMFAQMAAAC